MAHNTDLTKIYANKPVKLLANNEYNAEALATYLGASSVDGFGQVIKDRVSVFYENYKDYTKSTWQTRDILHIDDNLTLTFAGESCVMASVYLLRGFKVYTLTYNNVTSRYSFNPKRIILGTQVIDETNHQIKITIPSGYYLLDNWELVYTSALTNSYFNQQLSVLEPVGLLHLEEPNNTSAINVCDTQHTSWTQYIKEYSIPKYQINNHAIAGVGYTKTSLDSTTDYVYADDISYIHHTSKNDKRWNFISVPNIIYNDFNTFNRYNVTIKSYDSVNKTILVEFTESGSSFTRTMSFDKDTDLLIKYEQTGDDIEQTGTCIATEYISSNLIQHFLNTHNIAINLKPKEAKRFKYNWTTSSWETYDQYPSFYSEKLTQRIKSLNAQHTQNTNDGIMKLKTWNTQCSLSINSTCTIEQNNIMALLFKTMDAVVADASTQELIWYTLYSNSTPQFMMPIQTAHIKVYLYNGLVNTNSHYKELTDQTSSHVVLQDIIPSDHEMFVNTDYNWTLVYKYTTNFNKCEKTGDTDVNPWLSDASINPVIKKSLRSYNAIGSNADIIQTTVSTSVESDGKAYLWVKQPDVFKSYTDFRYLGAYRAYVEYIGNPTATGLVVFSPNNYNYKTVEPSY